jgi:hypothetical protein
MTTVEEFIDLLNETYPPVRFGRNEYAYGTALQRVDSELLNVMYHDYLDYLDEVLEDRVN